MSAVCACVVWFAVAVRALGCVVGIVGLVRLLVCCVVLLFGVCVFVRVVEACSDLLCYGIVGACLMLCVVCSVCAGLLCLLLCLFVLESIVVSCPGVLLCGVL